MARSLVSTAGRTVAVVGAGPAGALTAMRLLDGASAGNHFLEVVLIDPAERPGHGTAFSSPDPAHLLNVPAGGMSVRAEEPDDFVRWLSEHGPDPVTRTSFVSRHLFGRYVAERLALAAAAAGSAVLRHRRQRVVGIAPRSGRLLLSLDDGGALSADAVVLALGTNAPDLDFAPAELLGSERLIADPWAAGAADRVPADQDVLLVGTGLTMADVALSLVRPGRTVHAVSRHGLLPTAHLSQPRPAVPAPDLSGCADLDSARTVIRDHLADTALRLGDWRPAFDGLRPQIATYWQQLSLADRARFLREDKRLWEVLRHRMAPQTAAALERCLQDRSVVLHSGSLVAAVTGPDASGRGAVQATLSCGGVHSVGAVVACTGPAGAPGDNDPLVRSLVTAAMARPGPLGLGLDTSSDGRLRDGDGHAQARIWALGSLRRGNLWETTAIPEIRNQAAEVAAAVLGALRRRSRGSRPRDCYDLPLSTTVAAAAAYNRGLAAVLRVESGAEQHLLEAVRIDPGFALGHATLALLGHEWGSPEIDVAGALEAARALAGRGTLERERSFIGAVSQWFSPSAESGTSALLRHIAEHPRDALAISVAVPTIAFGGATVGRDSWQLVESLAPAYGDDWWYLAQLAFVRQDQNRLGEAERLAVRSLEAEPCSVHAAHALTHAFYETGRHEAGLSWLDGWAAELGDRIGPRAHFAWHAGLHELMLGDDVALRCRYERHLAPPVVSGLRALVDTASMLWRARVTSSWPDDLPIAAVLDVVPAGLLTRPPNAFTALHCAVALAAAGDTARLEELGRHTTGWPVVPQLCWGLRAVLDECWSVAIACLQPLLVDLHTVGGSAAQREVIEETVIHALVRADRHADAASLLSARLERRPSPLDRKRLVSQQVA